MDRKIVRDIFLTPFALSSGYARQAAVLSDDDEKTAPLSLVAEGCQAANGNSRQWHTWFRFARTPRHPRISVVPWLAELTEELT
jgi:hypothetical protein